MKRKSEERLEESLARRYRITEAQFSKIIKEYGTIENYLKVHQQEYVNIVMLMGQCIVPDRNQFDNTEEFFKAMGQYREEEKAIRDRANKWREKGIIRHAIDIDNLNSVQYDELYDSLYEPLGIDLYSSHELDRVLNEKLSERERTLIQERFGLLTGRKKSRREVAGEMEISGARVGQIEEKALKKLRIPSILKRIRIVDLYAEPKTDIERQALENLTTLIYHSNIIFKPCERYAQEPINIDEDLLKKKVAQIQRTQIGQSALAGETLTEDLEFSTETCNALRRVGINTLEQLRTVSKGELQRVGRLGPIRIKEIEDKLAELGMPLEAERDNRNSSQLQKASRRKRELQEYCKMLEEQLGQARELLNSYEGIREEVRENED